MARSGADTADAAGVEMLLVRHTIERARASAVNAEGAAEIWRAISQLSQLVRELDRGLAACAATTAASWPLPVEQRRSRLVDRTGAPAKEEAQVRIEEVRRVAREALQTAVDALARLHVPEEQTVINSLRFGLAPTAAGMLRRDEVLASLGRMVSRFPRACCRMRLVEQLPDDIIAERLGIEPEDVTRYVYYGLDFAARRLAAGPVARVRRQTWPLVLKFGLDPVEVDRVSHRSAGRRDRHDDLPLAGVPEDAQMQPA